MVLTSTDSAMDVGGVGRPDRIFYPGIDIISKAGTGRDQTTCLQIAYAWLTVVKLTFSSG